MLIEVTNYLDPKYLERTEKVSINPAFVVQKNKYPFIDGFVSLQLSTGGWITISQEDYSIMFSKGVQ